MFEYMYEMMEDFGPIMNTYAERNMQLHNETSRNEDDDDVSNNRGTLFCSFDIIHRKLWMLTSHQVVLLELWCYLSACVTVLDLMRGRNVKINSMRGGNMKMALSLFLLIPLTFLKDYTNSRMKLNCELVIYNGITC